MTYLIKIIAIMPTTTFCNALMLLPHLTRICSFLIALSLDRRFLRMRFKYRAIRMLMILYIEIDHHVIQQGEGPFSAEKTDTHTALAD